MAKPRYDPFVAFRFLVEIEGIITAGFTDISGLRLETAVETYREGGVNDFVHKLPKETTQSDLVLQHGITYVDFLWNWYSKVLNGKVDRKNISIYLLNEIRLPVRQWNFHEAYPIKWEGPALNSEGNKVAIESLTIAHHGMKQSK